MALSQLQRKTRRERPREEKRYSLTVVVDEAPPNGRWLRKMHFDLKKDQDVAVAIAHKFNVEPQFVHFVNQVDTSTIRVRILAPVMTSRLVVSDGSDEYPMSDYEDDEDDDALHKKPLVAQHKRTAIPDWAKPDKTRDLMQALEEQSGVDASTIFAFLDTVNLRQVFGYTPPSSALRAARKRKRAPDSNEDNDLPSKDDVEIHLRAGHDLTLENKVIVRSGRQYMALMRRDDKFANLRRHYAKHNYLKEEELVLCDLNGDILPLTATPRHRPSHLFSNPTASVIVKLKAIHESETTNKKQSSSFNSRRRISDLYHQ